MTDAIVINNDYGYAVLDFSKVPPNAPLDFDTLTKIAINLTPQSSPPSNPSAGWIYLDDGTNTASGNLGFRRYNGASWVDIGAASGGGGSPREITASSPLVVLGDTETLTLWRGTAPADTTLSINAGSLTDDTGASPAGCEIRLNNITDSSQTTLITSTYTESPDNNDIAVGGDDIIIEIYNNSGTTQNLSGNVNARLD